MVNGNQEQKKVPVSKSKHSPWFIYYFKFIVVILPLAVALAGFFLVTSPSRHDYLAAKQDLAAMEESLGDETKTLSAIKERYFSYRNINLTDLEKLTDMVPVGLNESNIFVNLESLVTSHELNLVLDDIYVDTPADSRSLISKRQTAQSASSSGNDLSKTKVSLSISGVNYLSFKSLLKTIELNLLLFDVNDFKFNPRDEKVEISLDTYYFKQ